MKIYLNRVARIGPWGGANRLICSIVSGLQKRDHECSFDVTDNADVILCMDPRPNDRGVWYKDLIDLRNRCNAPIVQRIGDLGTHGKPYLTELVSASSELSDFVIFPSQWAFKFLSFKKRNFSIVRNGADEIFFANRPSKREKKEIPRIVTHHWSDNEKKGFSLYSSLDEFCKTTGKFSFTFIGRKPSDCNITNYIAPLDGTVLANELAKYDIYVSASEEEAGANHVLEAMAVGLPVTFSKKGGSTVDYCKNFGDQFDGSIHGLVLTLEKTLSSYDNAVERTNAYSRSISNTAAEIIDIIEEQGIAAGKH